MTQINELRKIQGLIGFMGTSLWGFFSLFFLYLMWVDFDIIGLAFFIASVIVLIKMDNLTSEIIDSIE